MSRVIKTQTCLGCRLKNIRVRHTYARSLFYLWYFAKEYVFKACSQKFSCGEYVASNQTCTLSMSSEIATPKRFDNAMAKITPSGNGWPAYGTLPSQRHPGQTWGLSSGTFGSILILPVAQKEPPSFPTGVSQLKCRLNVNSISAGILGSKD